MAKKPDDDLPETNDDGAFDRTLRNNRRKVEKNKETSRQKAIGEMKDIGFWGVVGGIGFALDVTFLGGVGTAIALYSGAMWASHKNDERNARKEVERIDGKLMEIEELNALKPKLPAPAVKKEFNDNSEVADLQKKLADVQKELDEIKNGTRMPDKSLDKTKFSPPQL